MAWPRTPDHLLIREGVRSGEMLGPRIYLAAPSLNGNNARDPVVAARLVRERAAAGYDLLKIHGNFGRAAFDAIMQAAGEAGITVGGHIDHEAGLERTLASRQSTIEHLHDRNPTIARRAGYGSFRIDDRN